MSLRAWPSRYWKSFSCVGLVFATLFFSASVTPFLLPRNNMVQGLLSGFALAVGYGIGICAVLLYRFLEFPEPTDRIQRISKRLTTVVVALIFVGFLRQLTFWQNSIRELMEMDPLVSACPYRTALIAVLFGTFLIAAARFFLKKPQWLIGDRAPDVSPYLNWYPIATFLQIAFDMPMAHCAPIGYGHNDSPSSYIDAWMAVTQPEHWTAEKTSRLKELFATSAN